VLGKIFGPKEEEIIRQCRKLHKEELYDLYSSLNIKRVMNEIKKNEMGGACDTYWRKRGTYRTLVSKPEGERPFGSPRRRYEDNIKMDL
jgi:hypothetical protein